MRSPCSIIKPRFCCFIEIFEINDSSHTEQRKQYCFCIQHNTFFTQIQPKYIKKKYLIDSSL